MSFRPTCAPFLPNGTKEAKDWRAAGDATHFVQFYRDEPGLIEALGSYAANGVWGSERVVIIATFSHRLALEAALLAKGVDLFSAIATGQFLALDAAETLTRFMVDGRPDRRLFRASVGELVRHSTLASRRLRAFGEMVALLWAEGNRRGAIELEELWNELGQDHKFTLFCAYPEVTRDTAGSDFSFDHICAVHNRIIVAPAGAA